MSLSASFEKSLSGLKSCPSAMTVSCEYRKWKSGEKAAVYEQILWLDTAARL